VFVGVGSSSSTRNITGRSEPPLFPAGIQVGPLPSHEWSVEAKERMIVGTRFIMVPSEKCGGNGTGTLKVKKGGKPDGREEETRGGGGVYMTGRLREGYKIQVRSDRSPQKTWKEK